VQTPSYDLTPRAVFAHAVAGIFGWIRVVVANIVKTTKAKKFTFIALGFAVLMSSLMAVAQSQSGENIVSNPPVVNSIGLNSRDVAAMIATGMDERLNAWRLQLP
jgi:hypothetical protein